MQDYILTKRFNSALAQAGRSMALAIGLVGASVVVATAETYVCQVTKVHAKSSFLPQSFTFSTLDRAQAVKLDGIQIEGVKTHPSFPELTFRDRQKLRFVWPADGYETSDRLPVNHLRQETSYRGIYDYTYHVSFRRDTLAFSVDVKNYKGMSAGGNAKGQCRLLGS